MRYFGIDFGNGTCSISCIDNSGDKVEVLKDSKGIDKIKSTIAFRDLDTVIVGDDNIDSLDIEHIDLIKSKFGIQRNIEIQGQKRSVQYCGAILMNYLIRSIANKNSLDRAVITVPAIYGQRDRRIIFDSALQASIENVELIEEPSAAAMFYLYEKYKDKGQVNIIEMDILVFDFGTGTLDMSLINIKNTEEGIKTEVRGTEGERNLGGYLIDLTLGEFILDTYIEEFDLKKLDEIRKALTTHIMKYKMSKYDYLNEIDKKTKKYIDNLVLYAEKIKQALSSNESIKVKLDDLEPIEITKKEFENQVLDKYIVKKIEDLIKKFNYENEIKIDEIVMVGGSSQIPYIKKILESKYKTKKVITKPEYINAVALGAAITSALNSGVNIKPFGNNSCKGLISNDIYLNFNGEDNLIFKKGTSYPYSEIKEVRISYSLCSSIEVLVKENDEILDKINFYHPCFYTGDTINVLCEIDDKGLISFKAEHKDSKESITLEVKNENRLTPQQIEGGKKNINEKLKFI